MAIAIQPNGEIIVDGKPVEGKPDKDGEKKRNDYTENFEKTGRIAGGKVVIASMINRVVNLSSDERGALPNQRSNSLFKNLGFSSFDRLVQKGNKYYY